MKLKYGNIKATLAKVLNMVASDSRVLDYANRAIERLLHEGKWVDTTVRYQICVSEKCLVWPRQIETIEAVFMCRRPLTIRGMWYEALENGPGLVDSDSCGPCLTMIDRGNTVTFDWVRTTGYKLSIYADGTETAGTVLIRYFDSSGNKVYTTYLGDVIEGERLTIPAAGNYTDSTYEVLPYGIYHVEKPSTTRNIRLYAKKISDNSLIPLAYYEPDELLPVYRMSYLTELDNGNDCGTTQVTVIAKLRFIPAINDDSVMMISHADAIRLGVQAIKKEEDNLLAEGTLYWQMAIKCLNDQLRQYRGSGQVDPIRFVSQESWGGGICNIV
jgi:hypothetical protein